MIAEDMPPDSPPAFPAGEFAPPGEYNGVQKAGYVQQLREAPQVIAAVVEGLDDEKLNEVYRNWSIRQIVHHLADSHLNAYIRFKWALTEDVPLIKSYNETKWSEVADARHAAIDASLVLLRGLHDRWADLIMRLDDTQMSRTYFHPEIGDQVSLFEALPSYVWHTNHHVAQIRWLQQKNGWC